jgi:imidazolonepropionase
MPDLLVRNAGRIFGRESDGPTCVVVSDGRIAGYVAESQLASDSLRDVAPLDLSDTPELDATGHAVIPGFVDAHTHLVFAGDRAEEFDARLKGSSYQAGGIMSSVRSTRAATTDELARGVTERADKCLSGGTTTIEVKSGYGLDVDSERRSLQAIAKAAKHTRADLVPTFLGAHLDPEPGYIDMLINDMLPACAPYAESCDSFCDIGAVSVDDSRRVLEAGRRHGLVPRIHAEELAHTGGAVLAAELRCASADHLIHATVEDARGLAAAGVVAVLLPATSFCLRSSYAPARTLIDAGATVALATDCNPGTSYTMSMSFVIAVACSEYGMSAEEAVSAATRGGAEALRRHDIGHLGIGARADMVVIDGDHWVDIAYHPGMDVIGNVVKGGTVVR